MLNILSLFPLFPWFQTDTNVHGKPLRWHLKTSHRAIDSGGTTDLEDNANAKAFLSPRNTDESIPDAYCYNVAPAYQQPPVERSILSYCSSISNASFIQSPGFDKLYCGAIPILSIP
jgi:hypothetical protein